MLRNAVHSSGTSNLLQYARVDEDSIMLNSVRAADSLPAVAVSLPTDPVSPESRVTATNLVPVSLSSTEVSPATIVDESSLAARKNASVGYCPLRDSPRKCIRNDLSSASLDSGIGGDSSKRPSLENDSDKLAVMSKESSYRISQYAKEINQYPPDSCLIEKQILSEVEDSKCNDSCLPVLSSPQRKVSVSKEALEDMVKAFLKMLDECKEDVVNSKIDVKSSRRNIRRGSDSVKVGSEHKSKLMRKLNSASILCRSSFGPCDGESGRSRLKKQLSSVSSRKTSTENGPYSTVLVRTSTLTRKRQDKRRFSEILEVYKPTDIPYTEIVVPSFAHWSESGRALHEGSTIKGKLKINGTTFRVGSSPSDASFEPCNMVSSTPISEHSNGQPRRPPPLPSFHCSPPTSPRSPQKSQTLSSQSDGNELETQGTLNINETSAEDSHPSDFVGLQAPASITPTPKFASLSTEDDNASCPCRWKFSPPFPRSLGEVVDQNMPQFVKFTDWKCLYPHLISKNLLSDYMREYIINDHVSNQDKGNKFYGECLAKIGEEGYRRLLECLRDEPDHLGHEKLLKILEKHLRTL